MRKDKQKQISQYKDADSIKTLRLARQEEEKLLNKHITDIYKKISTLKIRKEQLPFDTFDGSYSEWQKMQQRLDMAIARQEEELRNAEDMLDIYNKEVPMNADDFGLNTKNEKRGWLQSFKSL